LQPPYRIFLCVALGFLCLKVKSSDSWQRVSNTTLRLPPNSEDATLLPPTLADTRAFSDLITLTPNAGIIPYDLNISFWSDGAHKKRWFCLPNTNLTIGFEREKPWSFPAGSVWIKHFELPLRIGDPTSLRRIETRFLVRYTDGVYGVSYRWDDSQTNAILVANEGLDEDIDIEDQGETHTQVWHYPGRKECLSCHTQVGGGSLGFNTWQLNRDVYYGGVTNNQIAALNQAGYFSSNITGIHTLRALAAATNTAWSLEYRVRSYLAANCAQCHQPGGPIVGVFWDARITTPTAAAEIINGPLVFPPPNDVNRRVIVPGSPDHSMMFFNVSNSKMPPLATTVVNSEAVNLLGEWITNGLANYQSFADWQLIFFDLIDLPAAAPDADPDNDGAVNELEYLVGGNPLVGDDAWKISIQPKASAVQIRFRRLANRAFEIQWTSNLQDAQSWVPLDRPDNRPFFSSINQETMIEDPIAGSSTRFYRVRIYEP
jgi:uncharacterized repeat protein (TIGR03806 family)